MAIPFRSEPEPVVKPIPAVRTWKVTIVITDTPGNRETYLSKEQLINAALYFNNKVQGIHIVSTTAEVVEPSLGRKAYSSDKEKEK